VIRWLVLIDLVLGLVLCTGPAIAAPGSGDAAKRLFDEGRTLAAKGKHLEACVLFEKSYELEPAVGTQLNLANCAERDGKPRKAWLLWIAAAEEFERSSDARAKFARGRADALAKKLATIVVRVEKPRRKGLVVTIAGRAVTPAREMTERVDAGPIEVTAAAPCCKEFRSSVTAEVGQETVVEIGKLERLAGVIEPEEDEPATGNFWRNTAIGGGIAMLVFGGATLYSMTKVNELEKLVADGSTDPGVINDGERWATVANVSLVGLGVASTVTVVALVKVLTAKPAPSNGVAWQVAPLLSPHGAGASLGITW
jgi:hypothetical protein